MVRAIAAAALAGAAAWCLTTTAAARERDALISRFDDRDYMLVWPETPPRGVLVLVHDAEATPLAEEAQSGLIEAAAQFAADQDLALLAPTAGPCIQPAVVTDGPATCWRLGADTNADVAYIERLAASVERARAVSFGVRVFVGRGQGADFLIRAAQAGAFLDADVIGLIAAGAAPPDAAPFAARDARLAVYLEAPEDDPVYADRAARLLRLLVAGAPGADICARAAPGGADYDGYRFADFLAWMGRPCGVDPETALEPEEEERRGLWPFRRGPR